MKNIVEQRELKYEIALQNIIERTIANKAYDFLEASVSKYRSSDSTKLLFLVGMVVALLCILLFLLLTPANEDAYKFTEVKDIFPIYRFVLCIVFTVL